MRIVWAQRRIGNPEQVARRICFTEQYYTGTRRYICVREDCRPRPGKTMCIWLEEFFHRAILYRHKKIYLCQGRLQAKTQENYVYYCDGFSSISQDSLIRLGSRLVWREILSVCIRGLQRGHPENPYDKD